MVELRPHYIDVDLKKNTQYNVPVVTQNDTATHFIIRVTDDGLSDPELLDAYQEITMTSQRPDGESFYLTGTRIPGTNEIEFHLGTDETAFYGSVLASLQFYLVEDASRYTSAQFRYDVKKDLTKNYTPTQREETLVEVVLRDGPVAIQEAKDAKIAVDGALVELEQDKTAAIERLDEVTEENKTVFRQPVNTFADLATSYPNPEHGTTVRVTGESATYRYSDGSWVKTDEYNPTAIDQVTADLAEKAEKAELVAVTAQLADTVKKDEVYENLSRKRDKAVKIDPEDFSQSTHEYVTGGTVNLLSIPQDSSVNLPTLDTELSNRIIREQNSLNDYPVEVGVVGASGTNNTVNYGIRTVGYIRVYAGTRVRLTDYENYRLRVARYSLDDKAFIDGAVNLVNDYFVLEDCYIRVTITNYPQSIDVSEPSIQASKCFIDHRYLEKQPSSFEFQNETVTLSYNPDGTIKNVVNDNGKERVTSSFSYSNGEIENITESIGQLTTITTIYREASGNVSEIRKVRSV